MGKAPIGPAGRFARQIADEIYDLTMQAGGDRSGRWLAEHTTRAKDYWRRGFAYQAPFNANDVEEAAKLFGITPYQLTRQAVRRGTSNVTPINENVDLETVDLTDYDQAATTKPDTGEPEEP